VLADRLSELSDRVRQDKRRGIAVPGVTRGRVDVAVCRFLEDREVQGQGLRAGLPLGRNRGAEQQDEHQQGEGAAHSHILT
jgi:hypothetical protein